MSSSYRCIDRCGGAPTPAADRERTRDHVVADHRNGGAVFESGPEHGAAKPNEIEAKPWRDGGIGEIDGEICHRTTGGLVNGSDGVGFVHVDNHVRADVPCGLEPQCIIGGTGHDDQPSASGSGCSGARQPHMAGPLDDDALTGTEPALIEPVDAARQGLEDGLFLGCGVRVELGKVGAGRDGHVLRVAAPQPTLIVGGAGVAVNVKSERVVVGRFTEPHQVDRHPVADIDPELGVGRQLVHRSDNLVAGYHRRNLTGHVMVAVELADIAVAQADGIDTQHGTSRWGSGVGEVAGLPPTVTTEHHRSHAHAKMSWEMIVFMISLVPP